jgi:hypothetical protein
LARVISWPPGGVPYRRPTIEVDFTLMNPRAVLLAFLRVVLAAHAIVLAQSVFAGEFLSGADGLVKFHEWAAWLVLGICAIQIGLAALTIRSGTASWWLLIGSVFVLLAEALQTGTGYGRFLDVHIPLGVIVFGVVLIQMILGFPKKDRT